MKRALVLGMGMLVCCCVVSAAQTLSGEWAAEVRFDLSQSSFSDTMTFYNTLAVDYRVGGWSFASGTQFAGTGWTSQEFSASGSLGAYSFGSSLVLTTGGTFDEWIVNAGIMLGGVTFGAAISLDDQDSLTMVLSLQGATDRVGLGVHAAFGDPLTAACDFDWQDVSIVVTFPFCCADVTASIEFACGGFQAATFRVIGLAIETMPWLSLDASLTYELESKTLTLAPGFVFGEVSCDFDLYFDITNVFSGGTGPLASLAINEIRIDGISLSCLVGGVEFLGISYWGAGDKPSILEGSEYWEAIQIATSDDGCCGLFAFELAVFFDVQSANLFDVAAIETNMSLGLTDRFTFSMGLDINVRDALRYWSVGFDVIW